jgi:NAD dependent epimerase/dehydratase family enzyme
VGAGVLRIANARDRQDRAAQRHGDEPGTRRLLRLVRFGLGGASGSGRQYVSWIHDADLLAAIQFLIARPDLDGIFNISSPPPLPNAEFIRTLREAWGMPPGLPAAKWMLEIGAVAFKTETELVLKSRRVVPARLLESGFAFRLPSWPDAARELAARSRQK